MWAIVPIKRFEAAKQRLSPVFSAMERAAAAREMAMRVLNGLAQTHAVEGVLVVSGEERLRRVAQNLGFDFRLDAEVGLNEALEDAMRTLSQARAMSLAIVHADLPLFEAVEFDRIAALHALGEDRKVTIVPDAAGEGTNLRFCRPGHLLPPLFGKRSALHHRRAAIEMGVSVEMVTSATLSLDCDTPEDVERILKIAPQSLQCLRMASSRSRLKQRRIEGILS